MGWLGGAGQEGGDAGGVVVDDRDDVERVL